MEIFEYSFFRNALAGLALVSVASAIIGTYVVVRRLMFVTGGITHACFGGLGLGYYAGVNPMAAAAVFAVASALGVEWMSGKCRLREDSAISVVWALGMAIGVIFIFLTSGYVPELNSFLFGNLLTISKTDLWIFGAFLAVLLLLMTLFYRPIVACAFDADYARTINLPVRSVNGVMIVMVSVCVVLTLKLIGIMLLMSLFAIPQMIAEVFTSRLKPMMVLASVTSLVCSVAGLFVSYVANVPASATIVVTLIAAYFLVKIAAGTKRRGKAAIKTGKER